jgi:hypothetical protein
MSVAQPVWPGALLQPPPPLEVPPSEPAAELLAPPLELLPPCVHTAVDDQAGVQELVEVEQVCPWYRQFVFPVPHQPAPPSTARTQVWVEVAQLQT